MIIDETFMWLYVTSKISNAFCCLGVVSLICSVFCAIVKGFSMCDSDWREAQITLRRLFYITFTIGITALTLSSVLPSTNDVKAYAAYAIGKNVATSNEAKSLFNAALKYIDGKTQDKD